MSKNGFLSYNNYKNAIYKIATNKRGASSSIQLFIGGYMLSSKENVNRDTRILKRNLYNFLFRHSSDGYYRRKFLLIDHYPDSLFRTGKAYISFEPFLFLEEDYTKDFIYPYVETLFERMDKEVFNDFRYCTFKKAGKNKQIED